MKSIPPPSYVREPDGGGWRCCKKRLQDERWEREMMFRLKLIVKWGERAYGDTRASFEGAFVGRSLVIIHSGCEKLASFHRLGTTTHTPTPSHAHQGWKSDYAVMAEMTVDAEGTRMVWWMRCLWLWEREKYANIRRERTSCKPSAVTSPQQWNV